jgi:hypothetical protein
MNRDHFLAHVGRTLADRGDAYGDALDRVAFRWTQTLGVPITPAQVCVCMIDMKIARLAHSYHADGVLDIAGYAALLSEAMGDGR